MASAKFIRSDRRFLFFKRSVLLSESISIGTIALRLRVLLVDVVADLIGLTADD